MIEQRRDWRQSREDVRDNRDGRRDFDRRDNDHRQWRGNDNDHRWGDNRDWGRRTFDNNWRNDRRYDWREWRDQNRDRYRLGRYSAPRGYGYHRFSQGIRIDPWYYSRSYWLLDPWYYRLPPAYGDYRWVRYFDDVALIDIRSGMIVDIIYDFFD